MKKSVFVNFAELNEEACAGCPCRAECTPRNRTRHRRLVAMGCELQAMLRGYEEKVGGLDGDEWPNLVPLALAHFGNEPRKIEDALKAYKLRGHGDDATRFKNSLFIALETLDRLLLNFDSWVLVCDEENEAQETAETAEQE